MKIAVASEDGATIAQHFGRSTCFLVFEVGEEGIHQLDSRPAGFEACGAEGHSHDHRAAGGHSHDHASMAAPILDCDVLLCGGIGRAAVEALAMQGILPVGAPADMDPLLAVKMAAAGRLNKTHGCNCTCGH